jgi:AraC-like DNA-binding protein
MEHSLLATFVLPIAQALRLQGIEPMEVIEGADIDPAAVINPDRRVPLANMQSLMRECVELTGDEAFGLQAAEQLQPQVLHGLGLAWLASDTIYDGLRRTVRFCTFMATQADIKLEEEGDFVHLTLGQTMVPEESVPAVGDFVVGMFVRMCQLTLGQFIAPVRIELERPEPEMPERWEYMLSSRVKFASPTTRMTWSLSDILEPLATGNPTLAKINDEQTQAYLDSFLSPSISREVVAKIVEILADGPPVQQQIADALNVSNRTLQRKLKEEGTSFMDLLNDTRLQLARRYLDHPGRSVLETAYLLGFSEPSTFSRAFKRWTGSSPADYRENNRQ